MQSASLAMSVLAALCLTLLPSSCAVHKQATYSHGDLVRSDSLQNIASVRTIEDSTITFEDCIGVYSPAQKAATGKSAKGETIVIPLEKIVSLVTQQSDEIASALNVLGGVLAGVLVLFLVALVVKSRP